MRANSSQSITWLHLSDLHLSTSKDFGKHFILDSLLKDIKETAGDAGLQPDFIIVSGDIAYSGQQAEYALARDFFDRLLSATSLSKDKLFIVPGNHDVDRTTLSDVLERVSTLLQRLGNYRNFVEQYFDQQLFTDESLSYTKIFDVADRSVAILGLNSAVFSASDDDRGRLMLGVEQVHEALKNARAADLRVVNIHHSFEWLNEGERAVVQPLLLSGCDFILHGHMHQAGLLQTTGTSANAMMISSGIQPVSIQAPHSYNFVKLDLSAGRGSFLPRSFSQQRVCWTKDVISYLNAPEGIYTFQLPDRLSSGPATLPEVFVNQDQHASEVRIFLSYAREDQNAVRRLYQKLQSAGFIPWMDTQDILPGERWDSSILKAIRDSHFFISCLSPNSISRRGYVQREIKMGLDIWSEMLESDIYLIPVRLAECEIPKELSRYMTADLFKDDGWTKLISAIRAGIESRGARLEVANAASETHTETEDSIPAGFKLQSTLRGHSDKITRLAWSPDGRMLASPSLDRTIQLWNVQTGEVEQTLEDHDSGIYSLAWSPDGKMIAAGSNKGTVLVWDVFAQRVIATLTDHSRRIECLDWSPDGGYLAAASADSTVSIWSTTTFMRTLVYKEHLAWVNAVAWSPDANRIVTGAEDNTIRVWDPHTGVTLRVLRDHKDWVSDVRWSHDGRLIASASNDKTIRLYDPNEGVQLHVLQGHTDYVRSISFSSDDSLLASKSHDNTVRLWRCDRWEPIATLPMATLSESTDDDINPTPSVAFHPSAPLLGTLGENDRVIRIWELDLKTLAHSSSLPTVQYVNAKVVLLGDGSVGKSGLGYRIAEEKFVPTSPTHGAKFWQIPIDKAANLPADLQAEITLWDLAGQADYHLVHVLFINDLSAALLLFDCSDAGNPFRGVYYWAKVLKQRAPADAFKLLVSSRCDICPVTVDKHTISSVLGKYEIDDYVCTSAWTGDGIAELTTKLVAGIKWDKLPRTTTPRLFESIRTFLLDQKARNNTLINMRGVWNEVRSGTDHEEPTSDEVNTVVSLLQSQGLVQRLDPIPNESFVLLRPDLINQYASSIIQAARTHPQGIGAVAEHEVVQANLSLTNVDRLNWVEEKIVLGSVVELLIKSELCFREVGMLVFPSQINVTRPVPVDEHPRAEVTYTFSGSVEAIFASLVVRLNHSQYFERVDQWKYAAEFSRDGQLLGFSMQQEEEARSNLEVYFHDGVTEFDRVLFIRFITDHLHVNGIDVDERIRLYCPKCGHEIGDREAIANRTASGKLDIPCQHCPDNVLVIIPKNIEEHYRSNALYTEMHAELTKAVERRTEEEAEAFKTDQRQYSRENNDLIHILHLSDLHIGTLEDVRKYRTQLETDLKRELEIHKLQYLVISGDVADKSTPEEYKAAFEFVDGLAKRFGLDPDRIIIAPGNHDLNWDLSADSYRYVPPHKLPGKLTDDFIPAAGAGALQRDTTLYTQRFAHFNTHFYKKIYNGRTQYPTDYVDQGILQIIPGDSIVFLALNSSWDIDHHFRDRASVNMAALSKALDELQDRKFDNWLKIAVWHHPVTGLEMMSDAFLELLTTNRFQICMHGHIHEAQKGFYSYDINRGIHIIGAGTFGAPAKQQVPGIPLQYNLIALDRESLTATVHTRKKEKPDGAWYADARWGDKNSPQREYVINLKVWTFSNI